MWHDEFEQQTADDEFFEEPERVTRARLFLAIHDGLVSPVPDDTQAVETVGVASSVHFMGTKNARTRFVNSHPGLAVGSIVNNAEARSWYCTNA